MTERLDYRDGSVIPVLGRDTRRRANSLMEEDPRITSRWEEIIGEHLANSSRASGPDKWKYIQDLVDAFPLGSFWDTVRDAICVTSATERQLLSLQEVMVFPTLAIAMTSLRAPGFGIGPPDFGQAPLRELTWKSEIPVLTDKDVSDLSEAHRSAIFSTRRIESVYWHDTGHLIVVWGLGSNDWEKIETTKPILWAELFDDVTVGLAVHKTTNDIYSTVIFNTRSPMIQWLARVKDSCMNGSHGLRREQYITLREMFFTASAYPGHELEKLVRYVSGWRQIPGLPPEIYPPPTDPTRQQFGLRAPPSV
jgi:hypothetical protein